MKLYDEGESSGLDVEQRTAAGPFSLASDNPSMPRLVMCRSFRQLIKSSLFQLEVRVDSILHVVVGAERKCYHERSSAENRSSMK